MLPRKTIRNVRKVFKFLCFLGAIPYECESESELEPNSLYLESLPSSSEFVSKSLQHKVGVFATLSHTLFISIRLFQAYLTHRQKFFLIFIHFIWVMTYLLVSWLHGTLFISRSQVKAYCNGLFEFYGGFGSMPGESYAAKWHRRSRKKPSLIDLLILTFLIGAVLNILATLQIFLIHPESFQFTYSSFPLCWRERFPYFIIPFVIYEGAMLGLNWAVMMFFIIIHIVHLFCTRDYLVILRKNTRNGTLKLEDLVHHYRSIQILHNHYNEWIASYMPVEMSIVMFLTFAANLGTIRTFHLNEQMSLPEKGFFPVVSVVTVVFQIIFYKRAGDLHDKSSFFSKGAMKSLYGEGKRAKTYLKSFPPLSVQVGHVLQVRKFTVVTMVTKIVVGTARLSVLFTRWKIIKDNR